MRKKVFSQNRRARANKQPNKQKSNKLARNIPPVELVIERVGSAGDGIGKAEFTLNYHTKSYMFFVPHTLVGERVLVQPISQNAQGIKAELIELISSSDSRNTPACTVAFECGGCQLQHFKQDAYRQFKQDHLNHILEREKLKPKQILPAFWADEESRRRAKINFKHTASGLIIGFFARQSHHIIPLDSCIILEPSLKSIIPKISNWLTPALQSGQQGQIHINMLDEGADILLSTDTKWQAAQQTLLASTAATLGAARISLSLDSSDTGLTQQPQLLWQIQPPSLKSLGLAVTPPAGGFLQSVSAAEKVMQAHIFSALKEAKNIIDLFSGCGTFSAHLLTDKKNLWALDSSDASCNAYQQAAQHAGFGTQLKVTSRNLFEAPLLSAEMEGYDAIIIDPPRAGAASQMPHLIASHIQLVVMVSCNPHSLARDLSTLSAGGFTLESVMLIDQFVWTTHCEAIAILKR